MAANPTHLLSQDLGDKIYQLVAEKNKGQGNDAIKFRQNELINTLQGLRECIRTNFERVILDQSQMHLTLYRLRLTAKELEGIFNLLTITKVTSLYLDEIGLNELGREGIIAVLGALPPTLTSLNLGYNSLNGLGAEGLSVVLGALPPTLTSLNLGYNSLNGLGAEGLSAVLGALPPTLTSLSLWYNSLNGLGAEGLSAVLRALPDTVTSLNLGYNDLDGLGAEGIIAVLGALPDTVTSLNLEGNYLYKLGREGLSAVLGALPDTVKNLNLGNNCLNQLGAEGLKKAFESLLCSDVTLFLEDNKFSDELINDIQKMMTFGKYTKPAKSRVAFFSPAAPSSLFSQAPSSSDKGKEKEESASCGLISRKLNG